MPTDDVGRVIVVDFGRESMSQPVPDADNDAWQPIGAVARRVLKGSIVAAGMNGSMSRERASDLIETLGLRHL